MSVEKRFGKFRVEVSATNRTYRRVLLDSYIYGAFNSTKYNKKIEEGSRVHVSEKQDLKLKIGFKSYARYGRINIYTMRAIRTLIKRGKIK